MKAAILAAGEDGDSIGGIVEVAAIGLRAGLGEHMFDGIENRISSAIFGIPAVKGIEFGNGFDCASLKGSENNDAFVTDGKEIRTRTNNCGGILGGMTTGMPLIFRAAFKPTPSIYMEQKSVSLSEMTEKTLVIKGRHDPCIVHRARIVVDCITALTVADILCGRFGTDWLAD